MPTTSAVDFGGIFETAPGANLVLVPNLQIIAVSDDYLSATMTKREEMVDRQLFDVFPDTPDDPTANGVSSLHASLDRVVASGRADLMAVQRYDIRRPTSEGGAFQERYWKPKNSPVLDRSGHVRYIVHHVDDVTALERTKKRLRLLTAIADRSERFAAVGTLVESMLPEAIDMLATIETSAYLTHHYREDAANMQRHLDRTGEQIRVGARTMRKIADMMPGPAPEGGDDSLSAELTQILTLLEEGAPITAAPGGVEGQLDPRIS